MNDSEMYDITVIGAGIHGAGIAQVAAAAGYKVLLLEQYDRPALATSCKSSKLIHGGLRYLESAQFALVMECLRERAILLQNAPQLVRLKPFHIPVYSSTTRRPWKIFAGLVLYSLFSRRGFHRVAKAHWSQLDGLATDNLDAVFCYYDAQTDDARLTRAVIQSAQSLGVTVRYNTEVQSAVHNAETVTLSCQSENNVNQFSTRMVINATGPWVDRMHARLTQQPPLPISLVQGAHIVLPGNVSHPYYLESPNDRRAVFVLPWKDRVMVGTTETPYSGDPAAVAATQTEIEYLLEIYNHHFNHHYTAADVIEAFAGLRVLPAGEGAAFSKSRDTVFVRDDEQHPRVVSVLGGKLTSYRATAEKLLHTLASQLPQRTPVADTARLKLPLVD
ncbi:MAG: glycerol-3-phosphate dehydrogenase/oxidase [Gammaproteobacteria bacterium]